jgi:GTPase
MFVDEVKIKVIAGKWGDGLVSWRREKYIPKWWPRGWDGGNGGSVIFETNSNLNTLSEFRHKKVLQAENWEKGGQKLMHGANGESLIIEVPVWTLIKDGNTGKLIIDLSELWQNKTLAYGGRGGYGNAHFVSSTRQAPGFAELWDIGEEKDLLLELKLVADVGIIGIPSAWKSSLISVITSVKPKIWDYPFTTLIPNLWVLEHKGKSLVIEDAPGLIPWASEGKWLGIQFLKHIERTRVLLHLLDISRLDKVFQDYEDIRKELELFSKDLAEKEELVVFSKADLLDEEMKKYIVEEFQKKYKNKKVFVISSATSFWLEQLKNYLVDNLIEEKDEAIKEENTTKKYDLRDQEDPKDYIIQYVWEYKFLLKGKRIEQIVRMSDFSNKEAIMRVYDVLDKIWVVKKIEKELAKIMESEEIGTDFYFEWSEEEPIYPKVVVWEREIPFNRVMYNLG